jgi:hypothetical protein
MSTKSQKIKLFRDLIRQSKKIPDYNVKDYASKNLKSLD